MKQPINSDNPSDVTIARSMDREHRKKIYRLEDISKSLNALADGDALKDYKAALRAGRDALKQLRATTPLEERRTGSRTALDLMAFQPAGTRGKLAKTYISSDLKKYGGLDRASYFAVASKIERKLPRLKPPLTLRQKAQRIAAQIPGLTFTLAEDATAPPTATGSTIDRS